MLKINGKKLGIRPAVVESDGGGTAAMAELMVFNPVRDATTIAFTLPVPGTIRLSILNVRGEVLATLVDGEFNEGDYRVQFDATPLPAGAYICRLRTCRGATSKLVMKQG
jgi:hypothetical protein